LASALLPWAAERRRAIRTRAVMPLPAQVYTSWCRDSTTRTRTRHGEPYGNALRSYRGPSRNERRRLLSCTGRRSAEDRGRFGFGTLEPCLIRRGRDRDANPDGQADTPYFPLRDLRGGFRRRWLIGTEEGTTSAGWCSRRRFRPVWRICSRCGQAIARGEAWDLDHNDNGIGYRGASHARCNRATAGRSAQLRTPPPTPPFVTPTTSPMCRRRTSFYGPPAEPGGPLLRWSRPWYSWR
jgi:hypothetical protein